MRHDQKSWACGGPVTFSPGGTNNVTVDHIKQSPRHSGQRCSGLYKPHGSREQTGLCSGDFIINRAGDLAGRTVRDSPHLSGWWAWCQMMWHLNRFLRFKAINSTWQCRGSNSHIGPSGSTTWMTGCAHAQLCSREH